MNNMKKKFTAFEIGSFISTTIYDDLSLSPNTRKIDKQIGNLISSIIKNKEFTGKSNESILLRTPQTNVLLIGLGNKKCISNDKLRDAAAKASITAKNLKTKSFSFNHDVSDMTNDYVEAVVQGSELGLYNFNVYKSNKKDFRPLTMNIIIKNKTKTSLTKSIRNGEIIADAIMLSRDISNLPSRDCTPLQLASRAKKISSNRPLKTTVFNTDKLKKLGFGGLLGVASGSQQPPCFIIMEYNGGKRGEKPIVFVGKTITFDTGGISIKPSASM
ncbi:MAG TPA: hypothetical protein EYM50_00740, partial [Nitrososphaerales archaeon]|nr:hypothetical protein [Nitrososphaerales archaeon]